MALTIAKHRVDDNLVITLEGRLDSTNSQELMDTINNSLQGVTDLVIDIEKLEYMSSAGLRVMLSAQKTMNKQGSMTVRNASELVRSVFTITGMDSVINLAD